MYGDWMDGVPLFIPELYEYNIEEAKKAIKYYEKLGQEDTVRYYEEYIQQQQKEIEIYDRLKIINFWR